MDEVKRMGRHTKLDDDLQDRFVAMLRAGHSRKLAAQVVGIQRRADGVPLVERDDACMPTLSERSRPSRSGSNRTRHLLTWSLENAMEHTCSSSFGCRSMAGTSGDRSARAAGIRSRSTSS